MSDLKPCPCGAVPDELGIVRNRTGEIDPSDEYEPERPRFLRTPARDKRIAHGDDFAGDAWFDRETKTVIYGAVGIDRNKEKK